MGHRLARCILAGIFLFTSFPFLFGQRSSANVDRVVVYKRERKLVLLSQGKELRTYKIALGSEPVGPKTRQGDTGLPRGPTHWIREIPTAASTRLFTSRIQTRKTLQPP